MAAESIGQEVRGFLERRRDCTSSKGKGRGKDKDLVGAVGFV